MASKAETLFRKNFMRRLDGMPYCFFESIQQKTIQGTPDVLGSVRGFFVAMEFKRSIKEEPTPLQKLKLERIQISGAIAMVVAPENSDKIFNFIKQLAIEGVKNDNFNMGRGK